MAQKSLIIHTVECILHNSREVGGLAIYDVTGDCGFIWRFRGLFVKQSFFHNYVLVGVDVLVDFLKSFVLFE